jgi:hypothetical protein
MVYRLPCANWLNKNSHQTYVKILIAWIAIATAQTICSNYQENQPIVLKLSGKPALP